MYLGVCHSYCAKQTTTTNSNYNNFNSHINIYSCFQFFTYA